MKITVFKAEETVRGDGWYYLINGVKDNEKLINVGGQDWYSSEKKAREAGKYFLEHCYYSFEYGWII